MVDGTGKTGSVVKTKLEVGGMRKGRAPVGEAWLLDGIVVNLRPVNVRYACHTLLLVLISPPPLNASRASTNLPFQTAGIERGSSRFSSLVSCKDVECMLRSGCSSPLGKLVRRVYVERESIKQALYWLWSLEPLPLNMIW